jgi:high-affinity K+ transport system ATPase subunit B
LIIPALIPLALKGVKFLPLTADQLLRRNILIFCLGGIVAPFIAIKLISNRTELFTHEVLVWIRVSSLNFV